ncbi:MAG: GntR family transcriptional regulator [Erysipelothrix sp.]|jgi:GntR family transcriptional regulator|nr:GntR family transcriptional regulator [Erysipelothrix sp.]
MFVLDYRSKLPIYEQIQTQMLKLIVGGVLKENDQLPAVRTLAMELGVNPNTVQKAYAECERVGMIVSVTGKGSFVSSPAVSMQLYVKEKFKELKNLIQESLEYGIEPKLIISAVSTWCEKGEWEYDPTQTS